MNSMTQVISSYNAERAKLTSLRLKLEKANASGNTKGLDDLKAQIAASESAVAGWKKEIDDIQVNAGTKPAKSDPGFSTTPTTPMGSNVGGAPAPASVPAGMSPQAIIGLALIAAIGGGLYLANARKKKSK